MCALPAQPTVSASSLVPSRLTSRRPVTSEASSAFAPSRPCSSDTVKRSSSGPWAISGSSATASAAATPMPLSAPSVVPSATTQSPSTNDVDPPFARVVRAVRVALADHVQVRLEDDGRRALPPGRGRYRHDDVALVVHGCLEAASRCPGERRAREPPPPASAAARSASAPRTDPRRAAGSRPARALISAASAPRPRREARCREAAATRLRSARRRTSPAGRSRLRA